MSEHKLHSGKQVIEALSALGGGLGYFVERELAVLKEKRTPPAVDVAWKKDPTQDFPLMIFEVESSAGNTIANNAVKVFSQPNQEFEKPLFFFHVIVRAGQETSRIDALRRQYGTNNYRVYRLDANEATSLIQDLLSQHRRLSSRLDVVLICEILTNGWADVDLNSVLDRAESLDFDTDFLEAYSRLSLTDRRFRKRFVNRLYKLEEAAVLRRASIRYQTFLGESWHAPIHLAILARTRKESANLFLERLRQWQEQSCPSTMIGPHFGLSRDYDDFILGISFGFWSAVAAVFGIGDAKRYVAEQMRVVCAQLHNARHRFASYAGVWLVHVAASAKDEALFDWARNFVNQRGGVSPGYLSHPPFLVPSFQDAATCEWDELAMEGKGLIPSLEEFVATNLHNGDGQMDDEAMRLGIGMLIESEGPEWFGPSALAILKSER